jgi:hypothetical protein
MSAPTRQELVKQCRDEYAQSPWRDKGEILDRFVKWTGYSRKYAITLLNGGLPVQSPKRRGRSPKYGNEVVEALVQVWHASDHICAKRLVPFLPTFVEALERFGHLPVSQEARQLLVSMSASTADRLLEPERAKLGHGISTTTPGRLLRKQIALRTHNGWEDVGPGFFEADLVAHCGGRVSGSYLYTLDMTDIVTGWTECEPLLDRHAVTVLAAVKRIRARLPMPMLGFDSDNGSEFINETLFEYFRREGIEFTRSRAYKKNDQAHIEERNGSVVRRLVGYDRYGGEEACAALGELYGVLRLHQNYFQPSLRLVSIERNSSHVTKRYDVAKTPLQRLLDSGTLSREQKDQQRSLFQALDPVQVLTQLRHLQDRFWAFAWNGSCDLSTSISVLLPNSSVLLRDKCPNAQTPETQSLPAAIPPQTPSRNEKTPRKAKERLSPRCYRRTFPPIDKPVIDQSVIDRPVPTRLSFADVQLDIDQALCWDPCLSGEALFRQLQHRYPGQFADGQLRTFYRRLSEWRRTHLGSGRSMSARNIFGTGKP